MSTHRIAQSPSDPQASNQNSASFLLPKRGYTADPSWPATVSHFNPFPSPPASTATSPSSDLYFRHNHSRQGTIGVSDSRSSVETTNPWRLVVDMDFTAGESSAGGLAGSWRVEGSQELARRLPDQAASVSRAQLGDEDGVWGVPQPHPHPSAPFAHSSASVPLAHGGVPHVPLSYTRDREGRTWPSPIRHIGSSQSKRVGVGPLPIAVWASVMDTSKGRDKVLKCLQYSLRTYLYLLSLVAAVRPLSPWFKANSKRMRLAVSGLSLTRKCLLLLNPLHPLTYLLSPEPTSAPSLIRHLIELASTLADDLYCLSRLGIVGQRTGKVADRWANRFWLLTTLMALYTLHLRTIPRLIAPSPPAAETTESSSYEVADPRSLRRSKSRALKDAKWTGRKLLADLIFVSYDVFELSWLKEPVQCVMGLCAAFISSGKLYDQHWTASIGKG